MRSVKLLGVTIGAALMLGLSTSCRAQYASLSDPTRMVVGETLVEEELVAASFRVLLEQIIGDSADRVCVSVAAPAADAPRVPDDAVDRDPSEGVLRRLRGGRVVVMARSVCAADERNFGPSRGHLRLWGVRAAADGTLTIDADAIGDHYGRYQCVATRSGSRPSDARCRLVRRD